MQRPHFMTRIASILSIAILTIACTSQLSESNQTTNVKQLSKTEALESPSLRVDTILQFSVMITAILQDSRGHYWFGSHGDGLCRYDGESYTYFTANKGLPNGSPREFAPGPDWDDVRKINAGNQIGHIQEDKLGNIWITNGDNRICKFDGQEFRAVEVAAKFNYITDLTGSDWEAALNDIWMPTWAEMGIFRYDGHELRLYSLPKPYSTSRDGVSEAYFDREGNLWFGTMDNGIFRYDGDTFKRINKDNEMGVCRAVFQDSAGKIWAGNNRIGLANIEGDSLSLFTTKVHSSETSESGFGAQTIEQDKHGDIWIGTFSDGLWRYDGEQINHYTKNESLIIETVKTIYKDNKGKLLFGIGEGSVYRYDGESFYRFDGEGR